MPNFKYVLSYYIFQKSHCLVYIKKINNNLTYWQYN